MVCPSCKGVGFLPTEAYANHLISKKKESFNTLNKRYYACINCGARFVTEEKLDHVIVERSGKQMTLFNDKS